MDSDSESQLISLISQVISDTSDFFKYEGEPEDYEDEESEWASKITSLIIQIVSLVRSMDLDSQTKPESKLMSLVAQTISLFNSTDLDSLPKPLSDLISLISQKISIDSDSDSDSESDLKLMSLVDKTLELKPNPELISLIRQIVSANLKSEKLISLCPQVQVRFREGKFEVSGEVQWELSNMWNCFFEKWGKFSLTGGQGATHFRCEGCNGEYHKDYEMAPLKIKHHLHQKHSLQLVLNSDSETRGCYCCDEDLKKIFYYCSACDYAMNIACVEKAPLLSIPHPKWHEHSLALFPRKASLTCDVCALADSNSPFYVCPPCDFLVHLRCINLPRVLRISRHPHRIYYTQSFEGGDWSCGVCRRKIDNDYGSYSCIRDGCSYAAHSRCATQSNVWDGIDLEGEPEEIEEEVEPFVRISDGIVRHFSHEHHHLRLDENTSRDYDENTQCQACITPIYFGNFYSCVQCEFVLHETCANLSRKLYHPIHPHLLTLSLVRDVMDYRENSCSACGGSVTAGFFYECSKEECNFQLHVQCATVSEPLVHEIHKHPLFLTNKPGEWRSCHVCRREYYYNPCSKETFNCIECDGFALCFPCATLPQKVRYKHDKHILTLSYGEKTSTIRYWCEACEGKIKLKKGFYMCDEYCCVTLHIECLIGRHLYMKPGSSISYLGRQVGVLPNNHHMSRPICSYCEKHCIDKIVFKYRQNRLILCSVDCLFSYSRSGRTY